MSKRDKMDAMQEKKAKSASRIAALCDLRCASELFRDLVDGVEGVCTAYTERYRENVAREQMFMSLPFEEVLKGWGIASKEEEKRVLLAKYREIWLGLLLALFGVTAGWLQLRWQALSCLSAFAAFSVSLLGLVLSITSYWRFDCLQKRRFLPLKRWCLCWERLGPVLGLLIFAGLAVLVQLV